MVCLVCLKKNRHISSVRRASNQKHVSKLLQFNMFCYYRPQNEVWGKVIFSEACVKNSVHRGGGIPACIATGLQGGWYPSMPCRFPGPHPGGKFRGIWPGGSPGPHPRGKLRGIWLGGLQAHTQGAS